MKKKSDIFIMLLFYFPIIAANKNSSPPKQEQPRSKLSMIKDNPLMPSTQGNPIILANRVLTETFYNSKLHSCRNNFCIKIPVKSLVL